MGAAVTPFVAPRLVDERKSHLVVFDIDGTLVDRRQRKDGFPADRPADAIVASKYKCYRRPHVREGAVALATGGSNGCFDSIEGEMEGDTHQSDNSFPHSSLSNCLADILKYRPTPWQ